MFKKSYPKENDDLQEVLQWRRIRKAGITQVTGNNRIVTPVKYKQDIYCMKP